MQVTEVKTKIMLQPSNKLRAFCTVTFDSSFVVRDLKIIESNRGGFFVAMPSRVITDRCPQCRSKNPINAKFCIECGHQLNVNRAVKDSRGYLKIHTDIAHPITIQCRDMIQESVIKVFKEELGRAGQAVSEPPKDTYPEPDDIPPLSPIS